MQKLKFIFLLFVIFSLCSCFSSDAKKSANFILNHGDKDLLLNMNESYKVSVASKDELDSNQTINIAIVSSNKDANNNDLIRIPSKKVLLSPYISESFISIYSNNSPGNVTIKFFAAGDESNAQYLNIKISNMYITVDGDTQNVDSPIYLPDISNTPGISNTQITRTIPIEIKSPNNVLDANNFQVTLNVPRNLPKSINDISNIITNKTKGDTISYFIKITYAGDGLFPDVSIGLDITDLTKSKRIAKITKRLVPISINADTYNDSSFSFISIYDSKGIFLTANEGKVDVPLKVLIDSTNPDGIGKNYKVTATVGSAGKEVNFGSPGEREISFPIQNFTTKMLSLYPVSKSETGIPLTIKVSNDLDEPLLTQTIFIMILKSDNQNIIVDSSMPKPNSKMLITKQNGVLSFYIPNNQLSYDEDIGGINISNQNIGLSARLSSMSPHKMYYIPYNISTNNGYAINSSDSEAILFTKTGVRNPVTSQPINYVINPIIAYSYLDLDKLIPVQMNSNNSLDFPLLSDSSIETKGKTLGIIFAVPQDTKFRERLFKILFNSLPCTQPISVSVKPPNNKAIIYSLTCDKENPLNDLTIQDIDILPAATSSYSATLNIDPNQNAIQEKIGINLLNVGHNAENKISIKSNNIVPAAGSDPTAYFFLLNQESAEVTVSLATDSPSLAVSLNFNITQGLTTMISPNCKAKNIGDTQFAIRLSKKFPSCQFYTHYSNYSAQTIVAKMSVYLTSDLRPDTSYSFKDVSFNVPICQESITMTTSNGGEIQNNEVTNKQGKQQTSMISNIKGFAQGSSFVLKGQKFYQLYYSSSNCSHDYPNRFRVSARLEKDFVSRDLNQFFWVGMDNYLLDDAPPTPSIDTMNGLFTDKHKIIGSGTIECKENSCSNPGLTSLLHRELEKSYNNTIPYPEGRSPMGIYYGNQGSDKYAQIATFVGLKVDLNLADINAQDDYWMTIHDIDTSIESGACTNTCNYKNIVR
jgi:hypothetical protein